MNVTQIIDQVLERTDNIVGSPADYLQRRQRLLEALRETADEIWWMRDWTWRSKRDVVTIPVGQGFVEMPADWSSFGNYGGVYQTVAGGGDGKKLDLVVESEIRDDRERDIRTTNPLKFAIFGQDAASYLSLLQTQINDAQVELAVWYQMNVPELDETTNVNNIKRIPEKYHQRVIVPGVRYRSRESKGDDRWKNSLTEYEKGQRWMLTEEARMQGQERQLPGFFGDE